MLRIGWFSTARTLGGSSAKLLAAALKAMDEGMDARIAFVFSNRDPGDFESTDRFFELVRGAGLPLVTLSDTKFRRRRRGPIARKGEPLPAWRREYDTAVAELIGRYEFDIGVMAGYMLILTDALHDRWPFINLHPALPDGPIGMWQDVILELIEARSVESGVLTFLATADLDRGPAITFCRYSLHGGEIDRLWAEQGRRGAAAVKAEGETNALLQAIRARGVAREAPLVVETLRAFAEGRLRVAASDDAPFRVVDGDGRPASAFDLTEAVEAAVGKASGDR